MCQHEELYEYFPAIVIGGPTGDYFIPTPTSSNRWTEFAIVAVTNGDVGAGSVIISGNSKPVKVLTDGSVTLNNDNVVKGIMYRLAASASTSGGGDVYERVTNSERKVFIRIDAAASNSIFVSLRFRNRIIDKVPGPNHTVHPNNMQDLNNARADATRQRLGVDTEIGQGEGLNAIRPSK